MLIVAEVRGTLPSKDINWQHLRLLLCNHLVCFYRAAICNCSTKYGSGFHSRNGLSSHGANIAAGCISANAPSGLINPLGQPPTQADKFKTQKSALPKLKMKGGDATIVTRTSSEWLGKTVLALNAWSSTAVRYWRQAVTTARPAYQQWTVLTPAQRAQTINLPSTGHALSLQMSVIEATMRAEL